MHGTANIGGEKAKEKQQQQQQQQPCPPETQQQHLSAPAFDVGLEDESLRAPLAQGEDFRFIDEVRKYIFPVIYNFLGNKNVISLFTAVSDRSQRQCRVRP